MSDTPENSDSKDDSSKGDAASGDGPDLKKQLESTLADLKAMAGEFGEKLGKSAADASVEAKERWKKVEPKVKEKLQAADKEIGTVGEAAAEQIKGLFGELKGLFGEIKSKVQPEEKSDKDPHADSDKTDDEEN